MSVALGKALSALSFWKPSIVRAFSSSSVRVTDAGPLNKPRKERSVEEKKQKAKERQSANDKERYQRLKNDPEKYEAHLSRTAAYRRERNQRIKNHLEKYGAQRLYGEEHRELEENDPERREEIRRHQQEIFERNRKDVLGRERDALSYQRWYVKHYRQDPESQEKLRERGRRLARQNASDDRHQCRFRLSTLLLNHPWMCQLPWKTRIPIVTPNRVRQICATCDTYRLNGAKLWWQRHTPSDPPLYDCQTCYVTTRPLPLCMPKGYEDVKTTKDLRARKAELDSSTEEGSSLSGPEHDKREV